MREFFRLLRIFGRVLFDRARGLPRFCPCPVEWASNRSLFVAARRLGYRDVPSDIVRYLVEERRALRWSVRLVLVPCGIFGRYRLVWQWQSLPNLRSASKRAHPSAAD